MVTALRLPGVVITEELRDVQPRKISGYLPPEETTLINEWTAIRDREFPEEDDVPGIMPPYIDEAGREIKNYKAIRRHRRHVVKAYVSSQIDRYWLGEVASPNTMVAMKRDAVARLMEQQAKGRIHPTAEVWKWLEGDEMEARLKWTEHSERYDEFPWLPKTERDWTIRKCGACIDEYEVDWDVTWNGTMWIPDRRQRLKDMVHKRMSPVLVNHHGKPVRAAKVSFADAKENEIKALQLLRDMVSTEVFRRYLKRGLVTTKGPSGLIYEIVRQSHFIYVWYQGTIMATLCVYLKDTTIPPTDEVITKMIMCEIDEREIWIRANVNLRIPAKELHQTVIDLNAAA